MEKFLQDITLETVEKNKIIKEEATNKKETEEQGNFSSQNFFVFVLYCTKRRCSKIKPQLNVEIEDVREAP